uniref:Salivary serine protease n=1 Tax=Simulium nigrimanum TaxID=683695 RepID=D1FPV0_SIMNI
MSFLTPTLFLLGLNAVLANTFTYKPAVSNEEFPWFCTVYDNEDFRPVCYCTILSKNAILTATRCFKNKDIRNTDEPKYHVRFGSIAENSLRKLTHVKEIVSSGNQHFIILRPKVPIEGYHAIELNESQFKTPDQITIATFNSYGSQDLMKSQVYMVTTKLSKDPKSCEFSYPYHFCAVESNNRCNIGLGAGAVSQSPRNSSRWMLHGVAVQSRKCDGDPKHADLFVKIDTDQWNWIKHNLN